MIIQCVGQCFIMTIQCDDICIFARNLALSAVAPCLVLNAPIIENGKLSPVQITLQTTQNSLREIFSGLDSSFGIALCAPLQTESMAINLFQLCY